MNETANRGKGPICACGIGELSLPATEDQTEPSNGETSPPAGGQVVTPAPAGVPVEGQQHKA